MTRANEELSVYEQALWSQVADVRMYSLRHSYLTFALGHGEIVLTKGCLLGHHDSATTLRHTHFADAMARDTVEAVGAALTG